MLTKRIKNKKKLFGQNKKLCYVVLLLCIIQQFMAHCWCWFWSVSSFVSSLSAFGFDTLIYGKLWKFSLIIHFSRYIELFLCDFLSQFIRLLPHFVNKEQRFSVTHLCFETSQEMLQICFDFMISMHFFQESKLDMSRCRYLCRCQETANCSDKKKNIRNS